MMAAVGDNWMVLAQFDLGLSEKLYLFMRLAAAVGGLVAGWFFTAPIVRLLFRAAFHKPVPPNVLPWCKVGGALLTAFLVYWYLPLGSSGGGGPGIGPGTGGPGDGKGSGVANGDSTKKSTGDDKGAGESKRETIAIELLGGDRYKDDQRYYLLERKEPAVTLKEVDKLFQDKPRRLQVVIVLTKDSVGELHGAVKRLKELARKYGQFTLTEMPESKSKASQAP